MDMTGAGTFASAPLTVNAAPTAPAIAAQTPAVAATAGGTANLAVVTTGFPAPTVQWQTANLTAATPQILIGRATPRPAFTNIAGATGTTLALPVTKSDNKTKYRVVITNALGAVTSKIVTVTVNSKTALANDLTTLQATAQYALVAINTCAKATAATAATLRSDLRRLHASASAKSLLATLVTNERTSREALKRNEQRTLGAIVRDAARVNAYSIVAGKHPSDSAVQTKLASAVAALQAAASSSTVPADATHCELAVASGLAPLESVNISDAKLQTDIEAGHTGNVTVGQALQAPMTIVQEIVTQVTTNA